MNTVNILVQGFRVTCLVTGQYNTKGYDMIRFYHLFSLKLLDTQGITLKQEITKHNVLVEIIIIFLRHHVQIISRKLVLPIDEFFDAGIKPRSTQKL